MPRPRVRFTREDYEEPPEHVHAELIGGDLVMAPPSAWHERLAAALMFALYRHLGTDAGSRIFGSRVEIAVGVVVRGFFSRS